MTFIFDDSNPDIWNSARDFEIRFLQDLRSAVSVDSCEAAPRAAAAILLCNVPGTLPSLAQLLPCVTRVDKFFNEVSKAPTAKFKNEVLRAAFMRNWPTKMKHLLLNSAPAIGETWETLFRGPNHALAD